MIDDAAQTESSESRPTIEFELSDSLHNAAVWRYWFRSFGWRMVLVDLILAGYIAAIWYFDRIGPYRWHLTIAVSCVVLYSMLTHLRFILRQQRSLRELPHRRMKLELAADVVHLQIAERKTTLQWRAFSRIMKYPEYWILQMTGRDFVVIPVRQVDPELLRFVETSISAGAKGGSCPQCRFDLRATTEPRCPECGAALDQDQLRVAKRSLSVQSDTSEDAPSIRFTAALTDEIFRAAYRAYWWHDWPQYAVSAAIVVPAFLLAWWLELLPSGAWYVAAGVVLIMIIFLVGNYYRFLGANMAVRKTLRDHTSEYAVRGETLHVRSDLGEAMFPFADFSGVLRRPGYLVIVLKSKTVRDRTDRGRESRNR